MALCRSCAAPAAVNAREEWRQCEGLQGGGAGLRTVALRGAKKALRSLQLEAGEYAALRSVRSISQRAWHSSFARRSLAPRAALSVEEKVESEKDDGDGLGKSSIEQHVAVLKRAAHTRKVDSQEVFRALLALEKAKLDPSTFFETIGGTSSPGRTWMLIFTANSKHIRDAAKGGEGGGSYFPITAVQRFDAQAMEIENGVFLGPVGQLTFKGPMNWIGRRLPFTFNKLIIKLGPLGPFEINIGKKSDEGREIGVGKEGSKDPFFIWFYADEEIIAARGRGGGSAFWVRCVNVKDKEIY